MRRICCFCESWESGGIESFLSNVLLQMNLAEMEVDIVAACIKESVFTSNLKERGVRFVELSGKLRSPQNYRQFRSLLRERKYDVVHLNIFQGMSLYYAHLANVVGIPVRIAHSHNTDLRKSLTRPLKLWIHRLYSHLYTGDTTDFWACSEAAARFMFPSQLIKARGFVFIPNGINTARFRFDPARRDVLRRDLGISDRFVIGNVGRLCYQKNQSFLLDVLVEAQTKRPNCCLLLVGEGEDRQTLEGKAQNLGVRDRVIFYGTTDKVEELFWAMDVFAFPSLFEGLGIVAVEAQAAGLPIVCSEHIPEEANFTSLFFRQSLLEGADAWADTICEALAIDRDTTWKVCDTMFDIADVSRRIEKIYLAK